MTYVRDTWRALYRRVFIKCAVEAKNKLVHERLKRWGGAIHGFVYLQIKAAGRMKPVLKYEGP